MKQPPIIISLDSNEQGSPRATALAQAVGGDHAYELEWRDEGEITLETEEEQAVRESIDRQRATA